MNPPHIPDAVLWGVVVFSLIQLWLILRGPRPKAEPPMIRVEGENIVVPVPAGAAADEVKVVMRVRCNCPGRGDEDLRLAPGDQFVFPCCEMRLTARPGLSDGTVTLTVTGPES